MNRLQVGWWAALVLSALGCTSSQPESELAAACFDGVELEAWELRFSDYCVAETDDDVDGEIDARDTNTYDDEGRLISRSSADGAELRLEWDDRDRIVLQEQIARDGTLVRRSSTTFDERSSRTEEDFDGDGLIDTVTVQDYACFEDASDPPGFCVSTTDQDVDGDFDRVLTNEWDEDGLLVSTLYEYHEPEARVERVTYSYDDDGEPIGTQRDVGDDGTIDSEEGTERVSDRVTRNWQDLDGDGERDGWVDTEVDADGNLVSRSQIGGDGELLERAELTWVDGRPVRVASMSPVQPEYDYVLERRFDASGNLVASATDEYPFGSPDQCTYYSYSCWPAR